MEVVYTTQLSFFDITSVEPLDCSPAEFVSC